MNSNTAHLVLNYLPGMGVPTRADLKERYRILARQVHPDRGGDVDRFHAVETAYRTLQAHFATRPCVECRGKKVTVTTIGWRGFEEPCRHCAETGVEPWA